MKKSRKAISLTTDTYNELNRMRQVGQSFEGLMINLIKVYKKGAIK